MTDVTHLPSTQAAGKPNRTSGSNAVPSIQHSPLISVPQAPGARHFGSGVKRPLPTPRFGESPSLHGAGSAMNTGIKDQIETF